MFDVGMTHALFVLPGSLLSSLRYPHQDIHGMAAWGPDARTGRAHAWVKWDGRSISAEWAGVQADGSDPGTLSVRWAVGQDNRPEAVPGHDSRGLLDEVLARFESISRADCPSFIRLPRPPRPGF